jgi:hypothetical protein
MVDRRQVTHRLMGNSSPHIDGIVVVFELAPRDLCGNRAALALLCHPYPTAGRQGFSAVSTPRPEIAISEVMGRASTDFTQKHGGSRQLRKEALGLLLNRSAASTEATLAQAKLGLLEDRQARELLSMYRLPGQPPTYERR